MTPRWFSAILRSSSVIPPNPVICSSQSKKAAIFHPAISSLTPFDSMCVPEKTTQFLFRVFICSLAFKTSSPTTPRNRSMGIPGGNWESRWGETAVHPETLLKILLYTERWYFDNHPSVFWPTTLTNTSSSYCKITGRPACLIAYVAQLICGGFRLKIMTRSYGRTWCLFLRNCSARVPDQKPFNRLIGNDET